MKKLKNYIGPTYNLDFKYQLTFSEKLDDKQLKEFRKFLNGKIRDLIMDPSLTLTADLGSIESLDSGIPELSRQFIHYESKRYDKHNKPDLMSAEWNTDEA